MPNRPRRASDAGCTQNSSFSQIAMNWFVVSRKGVCEPNENYAKVLGILRQLTGYQEAKKYCKIRLSIEDYKNREIGNVSLVHASDDGVEPESTVDVFVWRAVATETLDSIKMLDDYPSTLTTSSLACRQWHPPLPPPAALIAQFAFFDTRAHKVAKISYEGQEYELLIPVGMRDFAASSDPSTFYFESSTAYPLFDD